MTSGAEPHAWEARTGKILVRGLFFGSPCRLLAAVNYTALNSFARDTGIPRPILQSAGFDHVN